MGDKLSLLLEVFHKIENAGRQATLSAATVGGKTKLELEIGTTSAPPSESSLTSPRCCYRRRNQRAAAHQAALVDRGEEDLRTHFDHIRECL